MNGMELALGYWNDCGKPVFARYAEEFYDRMAVGLAGDGSECFGYDDKRSRDHDWGPSFCIWLCSEDYEKFGDKAEFIYASLPENYMGFLRRTEGARSGQRRGVWNTGAFYFRYIGIDRPPESNEEWMSLPETGLAAVTNGKIFSDGYGAFTEFRNSLLWYYPDDVWRKKLAACCAVAAQAGQYNFRRCVSRGDMVAAHQALAIFIDRVQQIIFILNRKYRPYYKWANRRLRELPLAGAKCAGLLDELASGCREAEKIIDLLSSIIADELRSQQLSKAKGNFLIPHAEEVQSGICDPRIRNMHLMAM